MLCSTDGLVPLHGSTSYWNTRRDEITQWQMHYAELLLTWTWTVKSILDEVTLGSVHQAEVHNPAIVEDDCSLEQEVHVAAGHTLVQMHITDCTKAQKEDPVLSTLLNWLKAQNKTDLMAFLVEHASGKEGKLLLYNQQNFMVHQRALYLCSLPKGETENLLLFVGPQGPSGCHLEWVSSRCRSSGT